MSDLKTNIYKFTHTPVMIKEVIEYLSPHDGAHYLDTTFGAGGYSRYILESANCRVTALDQDPTTNKYAKILQEQYGSRFNFINANFSQSKQLFDDYVFNGIVMDLGVSSMQLDIPERGFSFAKDGPLDMRMSNQGVTAADFINTASEQEIADVIFYYGEEHASRKIAKNIVKERIKSPIINTLQLAEIIHQVKPVRGKIDSATKTFQAIRIYINNELGQLTNFLNEVQNLLTINGRLIAVSFHSLEDRIIKNFIKENSAKKVHHSKYSTTKKNILEEGKWMKILTKKPITPTLAEIKNNPRSRSAKLRAVEKLDGK